ncbi:MAG TPA: formylmethanofuran dehydrogenase [Clostridiales bacterium]|nr:formylmethanofuran dehydrogenase [Clostridiales bacterium]
MKDADKTLWGKCVAFHGHVCGGLAIGYQAGLYAIELLGLERAEDEEVVCITENDACGVDAIQVMLGCTIGKGNLLIKLRGKQAFSFYNRKSGKAVRLVLRDTPEISREQRREIMMQGDYHDFFDVKEAVDTLPEMARIFKSYTCARCGELTAESHTRLYNGEYLCTDCLPQYRRFL